MSATAAEEVSIRDPYEVLGVEKSATEDQIKSAYKKCALKYHPDKNRGEGAEEAEKKFKEVVTAFNILSDPDKRRRYDAGGFENLEASDLSVELDLSSMGWGNTMVAAMFSKLGVPIKTTVSQGVLDIAASGSMTITRLEFGHPVKGKVDKQEAVFFEVEVTEQDLQEGFYIFANSPIGSKFKLLHFDKSEAGGLQLNLQEDSTKMGKAHTTAGLFFLPFETYSLGPKVNPMDLAEDPEAPCSGGWRASGPEKPALCPRGFHTFAVYGDNWFKRGQYQLEAVKAQKPGKWGNALAMRDIEGKISSRKEEIKKFEKEFRRIQSEYLAACEKFTATSEELEDLLRSREEAYLALFESEDTGAAQAGGSRGGVLFFGGGGASSSNNGGSPDPQQVDNGNAAPKKDRTPLGLGAFRLFSAARKKPGDETPNSDRVRRSSSRSSSLKAQRLKYSIDSRLLPASP